MEITRTEIFTVGVFGMVLIQALIATISITVVATLVAKTGWKRRYAAYVYQLGLLVFYAHFLFCGPPPVLLATGNILYWAAILGTAPANLAPLLLERPHFAALSKRSDKHPNVAVFLVIMWILSALFIGSQCWSLAAYLRVSVSLNP